MDSVCYKYARSIATVWLWYTKKMKKFKKALHF